MKKLLLILLLFITFISYGQTDSTQYVTNSNVEKLVDKYSEKIESAIIALSDKLQQPVEHIYKLMIKQQLVKGISSIIVFFMGLIITIIGVILMFKDYGDEGTALTIIGGIILLIGIIWFFSSGITCLFNSEYAAIKEIIKMIK